MSGRHRRAIQAFPIGRTMTTQAITSAIDARHFGTGNAMKTKGHCRRKDQSTTDTAPSNMRVHFSPFRPKTRRGCAATANILPA
jgi:hypothetical protein